MKTKSNWSVNVTKKGNTKISGRNKNVGNTYNTVNVNVTVSQNSELDFKTKCIVGGIQSIGSYLKKR